MNHLGRKPVLSLYMLMVAVIAVACGGGGSGTLAGGGRESYHYFGLGTADFFGDQ